MTEIEIFCDDQELKFIKKPLIASGGANENRINFRFSEHWDGFEKKVNFYKDKNKDRIIPVSIKNDSCIIPSEMTFEKGNLYISINGTFGNLIRTSNEIKYVIEKGSSSEAADPYEPIRKEAYEKGYNDGYTGGYTYTQSLIDYMENCTDNQVAKMIEAMGSPDNLVSLPYANTEKVHFDIGVNGKLNTKYFSSIGLAIVKGNKNTNKRKLDLTNMQKLILTGYSSIEWPDTIVYGTAQCFKDGTKLEELYIDYLKPMRCDNPNWAVYSYQQTFANCNKLRIIGGFNKEKKEIDNDNFGKISFHGCKNTTDMFKNCYALKEVRFEPLKLNISLSMTESSKLSQQSVMSLINALDLVKPSTITMHPDIKNAMEYEWWCSWRADTGLYYITDPGTDPTAIPFSNAVSAKGWVIE